MDVVPVIDIKGGVAVAGKQGKRETYLPLKSIYADTSDPIKIAEALPFEKLYVADLDGITHGTPDYPLLWELSLRKKIMVDAGVSSFKDVTMLAPLCCDIILGTETIRNVRVVEKSVDIYGDSILVSLDIKDDKVISRFLPSSPFEAVRVLEGIGVERVILLDISSVGTLKGCKYEMIEPLVKNFHSMEFFVGGGIKPEDLGKMEKIGVKAVLMGTALHSGMLER